MVLKQNKLFSKNSAYFSNKASKAILNIFASQSFIWAEKTYLVFLHIYYNKMNHTVAYWKKILFQDFFFYFTVIYIGNILLIIMYI